MPGLGIGNWLIATFLVLIVTLLIVMDMLSHKNYGQSSKEDPMKKQCVKQFSKSCWKTILNMGTSYVAASLPT